MKTKRRSKAVDVFNRFNRKSKPQVKREPRQKRLPTMEDPAISELEAAAELFDELRVKRQAVKSELIDLMKQNGKTVYNHAGTEIKLTAGHESVSVKVSKIAQAAAEGE